MHYEIFFVTNEPPFGEEEVEYVDTLLDAVTQTNKHLAACQESCGLPVSEPIYEQQNDGAYIGTVLAYKDPYNEDYTLAPISAGFRYIKEA